MEELDNNLEQNENINKTEERIKDLSSKVKLTAQERDELATAKTELESQNKTLEKERDFYQSFSQNSAKFPKATEHIDEIKAKVLSGYSPEDAIVSVLNAKGELLPQDSGPVSMGPIAGGSAQTNLVGGEKSPSEMSREEMRAKLVEADKTGELAEAIRSIGR